MSHTVYACPTCDRELFRSAHPVGDDSFLPLQKFVCPDCKTRFPWYRFKIRTSNLVLTQVGGGSAATGLALRQTLLPVSGRFEFPDIHNGIHSHLDVASPADLSDGSDSTFDRCELSDSGGGIEAQVMVAYTMEPVVYAGPIQFLRFHVRAKFDLMNGVPLEFYTVGTSESLGGSDSIGSQQTITTTYVDYVFDEPEQIHTPGNIWTADYVNNTKLGWSYLVTDPADSLVLDLMVSRFRVEVWG